MKTYENYLGIPDLTLVWYSSQDDNELIYDGIHMDYVDVQSAVYERYCEECGEESYTDDAYDAWLKQHLGYVTDEMLLMGDWLFDCKAVGDGKYHSYLEPWKYRQMLGKDKEETEVA